MQEPFPARILYGGDYNPEQWSEDVWLEDMRLMKLANVNMASINIFSWASLEPAPEHYQFSQLDHIMDMLAENGIAADLATATASPPTWMSRLYPDMLPVTREGTRLSHGSRQHYCPNRIDFRREAAEFVRRLAKRYATHPALTLRHVNNGSGSHALAERRPAISPHGTESQPGELDAAKSTQATRPYAHAQLSESCAWR